jgi:N-acetylneuraminate synthase/N,N'-diacetyllegionaminate synthase
VTTVEAAGRTIGPGAPCVVIAEIGQNHFGNRPLAVAMVDAACAAGATAVKFQTITPGELHRPGTPGWQRLTGHGWTRDDYQGVKARAEERGALWFSTPFDEASVDLLAALDVPLFKVSSADVTHLRLLRHIGGTKKPVILSTGLSALDQVARAIDTLASAGAAGIVLLHCVSLYPTPAALANVRGLETLRQRFGLPVGVSDHTTGLAASVAAVALGACVVERHFTLSRGLPALPETDNDISLEPDEFTRLVAMIREVEAALGTGVRELSPEETAIVPRARRSPYARRALAAGHRLASDDLVIRRPLTEIGAEAADTLLGRRLLRDVAEDAPLTWDLVAEGDAGA